MELIQQNLVINKNPVIQFRMNDDHYDFKIIKR